jgi:flagellar protein FlbB
MAQYGSVGAAPRIIVLLLLVAVLVFGGALWFDYLGIIDVKDSVSPLLKAFGIQARSRLENPEAAGLLDQERLGKLKESIDQQAQELAVKDEALKAKEAEINQKLAALDEQEKAFQDREKSFNERIRLYDNKRANLEQNSRYLTGMPPAQAVGILVKMDDQDVIDHLRVTEELAKKAGEDSIVSFWLSQMPPERAAVIQRKMSLKPESY